MALESAALVSANDDFSRVMVLDDGFAASRIDGVWSFKLLFSADELKDDFSRVRDAAKADAFLSDARRSASDKSSQDMAA